MKILFYYRESESIGIGYLMSLLKQAGHEVGLLFESAVSAKYGMIEFGFLRKLEKHEKLITSAREFDPDLLAFSSDYYLYPHVRKVAETLKKELKIPTIMGGIQPSSAPENVLNDKFIDMICIGEGEGAMLELAETMERGKEVSNIENIWTRNNGNICTTPLRPMIEDLDKLPFPDRELFFKNNAFQENLMVISSRGCPYNCSFCHNQADQEHYNNSKKFFRRRSVDNVLGEIKICIKKYPIKRIEFEDEVFNLDKKWFNEFCVKYSKEINLPFWCQLRANTVTEDVIEKLNHAGCVEIFVGVESGNENIRNNILKKRLTTESILKAGRIIKNAGIRLQATGMFAIPGETDKEMFDTVSLLEKLNANSVPTYTLFPFPKTPILKYAIETGYLDENVHRDIMNGDGGIGQTHGVSVLRHKYAPLAYNISKLLSLYLLLPQSLKPLFKKYFFVNKYIIGVGIIYNMFLFKNYYFHSRERLKLFIKDLICSRF
jgi:radical SAM superfamily enzyme YgiQ (UPF0313 family)